MANLTLSTNKGRLFILCLFSLFLPSCVDPCANTYCENDGFCMDGTCNCAEGFGGEQCKDKLVPVRFTITKIEILKFPTGNPSGYAWDGGGIYPGSGPADLVVKLFDENFVVGYTNTVNDAAFGTTLFFPSVYELSINHKILLELHDRDSPTQGEFIGGYYFYASQYAQTPTFIELYNDNTPNLKMRVFVNWFY